MTVGRNVVVAGVDGSASALEAVRWAAAAVALQGPLRLVHAYTVNDSREFTTVQRRDQGGIWLHEADIVVRKPRPGVKVETALREGDPRVVLLRETDVATLAVLGSRRLGSVSRVLLGSVGLAPAGHGRCPVGVVRGAAPERGPVVVGVDGWPERAPAARFAFAQAALRQTGGTAVRTWRAPGPAASMAVHEQERAALIEQLSSLSAESAQVPVEHIVVRGRPGPALLDYGSHARLIVVGTRRQSGLAGVLIGSTSQAVVQHSTCPVAVVRSDS